MVTTPAPALGSAAHPNHPTTYEAELRAMNRARVALYRQLRDLGHPADDALAAVNAVTLLPIPQEPGQQSLFDAIDGAP